ncbi:APC family permease [Bacillus massiliigorillae]|uniref:APC family permease n=1 Tax=Bacillus massiliigorillae TaxID=1243664 RepID=UPI0003A075C5|nr:APC family permease [Bacillus massiliigorillae]
MEEKNQLKRNLKLWHIFVLGLALLCPTTVFDTYGIATGISGGHVPTAYMFTLLAILFTAFSYANMVKVYPEAGSAYSYVQKVIDPNIGFMVGWAALCDYIFLPMVYALSVQIYMGAFFPSVPVWIWVFITMLFCSVMNIFNTKVTVTFNTIFVILQITVAIIFVALLIQEILNGNGTGHVFSLEPIYSANLTWSTLLAGSTVLAYSFIGFDAISTLSEDAIQPQKNIPRAMVLLAVFLGLLYTTITYFMQSVYPDVSMFKDPEAASAEIAQQIGGLLFATVFLATVVTGSMVGGITAQLSTTRLLYAMGRDGVLPKKIFGYVNPKTGVPVNNVIISGLFGMTAVFFSLVTATSFISFGAFTAFTFVNLSVIIHYIVKKKERSVKALIFYLLFPLLGLSFIILLWFNMDKHALYMGLIWNVIGVVYLMNMTKMFKVPPPILIREEKI